MQPDGHGGRRRFPQLGRLTRAGSARDALQGLRGWAGRHLGPLLQDLLWRDYQDTLRRLLREGFDDLSPAERARRADDIVDLSAKAAMAMSAAPVPFLELPVQVAMVRAIARVYGNQRTGPALLREVLAALGGGIAVRQLLRLLPIVGRVSHLSRAYGATWALGRTAQVYFSTGQIPDREHLRSVFRDTVRERTQAPATQALEARLQTLDDLHRRGTITDAEYRRRRRELLAEV